MHFQNKSPQPDCQMYGYKTWYQKLSQKAKTISIEPQKERKVIMSQNYLLLGSAPLMSVALGLEMTINHYAFGAKIKKSIILHFSTRNLKVPSL